MSQAAFLEICRLVDKTVNEAETVLVTLPRRPEQEKNVANMVHSSPQKNSKITMSPLKFAVDGDVISKVYRTTSDNGLILAHYIDLKKPMSGAEYSKFLKYLHSTHCTNASSSSSSFRP